MLQRPLLYAKHFFYSVGETTHTQETVLVSSEEHMDRPESSYLYFLGFFAATGLMTSEITDLFLSVNISFIPLLNHGHVEKEELHNCQR